MKLTLATNAYVMVSHENDKLTPQKNWHFGKIISSKYE